jgi:hypothetical protein
MGLKLSIRSSMIGLLCIFEACLGKDGGWWGWWSNVGLEC